MCECERVSASVDLYVCVSLHVKLGASLCINKGGSQEISAGLESGHFSDARST